MYKLDFPKIQLPLSNVFIGCDFENQKISTVSKIYFLNACEQWVFETFTSKNFLLYGSYVHTVDSMCTS